MPSLMRTIVSLMLSLMLYMGQAYADTEVRDEQIFLPIQIGDHVEKIEALIVRPVEGEKFPLALIINGTSRDGPSAARADWLAGMAHDYAHRGWLAASIIWPGYGYSSGSFVDNGGDCVAPKVADFLGAHGSELAAALAALRQRSDIDPSLALGVGVSIGGVSMLNLGAQSGHPLAAIINISGGVAHSTHWVDAPNCSLFQSDLVQTVARFGAENPTPTLWIYAQNDHHFGPDLVSRMIAGYRSQGGKADLVMLPTLGEDGHTLYRNDASALINPNIDDFLRRNRLPAMNDSAFTAFLSRLTPIERTDGEVYALSVTEKALAMSKNSNKIYQHYGDRTLEGAREKALTLCQKDNGDSCRIVAENQELMPGWQDVISSPVD
ncbi:signal peptide protein [Pseudomonas syringae pv. tomato]|nr:signal peptide protein [Pseudomonas syringae pv. tomato]